MAMFLGVDVNYVFVLMAATATNIIVDAVYLSTALTKLQNVRTRYVANIYVVRRDNGRKSVHVRANAVAKISAQKAVLFAHTASAATEKAYAVDVCVLTNHTAMSPCKNRIVDTVAWMFLLETWKRLSAQRGLSPLR